MQCYQRLEGINQFRSLAGDLPIAFLVGPFVTVDAQRHIGAFAGQPADEFGQGLLGNAQFGLAAHRSRHAARSIQDELDVESIVAGLQELRATI